MGAAFVVSLLVSGSAAWAQAVGNGPSGGTALTTAQKPLPDTPEKVSALLVQLGSSDRGQREQAADKLQQIQRPLGQQVLEIAKKRVLDARKTRKKYTDTAAKLTPAEQEKMGVAITETSTAASETILLLGRLHVEEAIPFLLDNILFVYTEQSNNERNYPLRFPCLGALIALGPPAADTALHAIEEQPFEQASLFGKLLLAHMLGPRGAMGYLQDRIDFLKDPPRRYLPGVAVPGKPLPAPKAVRIARLEAVRADIEANEKVWAEVFADEKPYAP